MESSCTEKQIFSKLKPDDVQTLSNKIASFFYETLSSETVLYKNKRLEVIVSLKKLYNNDSHFRIDEGNFDCFLKPCLGLLNLPLSDYHATGEAESAGNVTTTTEVCTFNKKLDTMNETRLKFVDGIRRRDRMKYNNNAAFDAIYRGVRESVCGSLLALSKEQSCRPSILKPEPKDTLRENYDMHSLQENAVGLGYALLNFPKNDVCMTSLCNVLEKLSSLDHLSCLQIDFINYVWTSKNNLGTNAKVTKLLLEHFTFIYEKQFIVLCTNVIQNNLFDSNLTNCKDILTICADNKPVLKKISNLCYELFAYSNYNLHLYDFLIENNFIS